MMRKKSTRQTEKNIYKLTSKITEEKYKSLEKEGITNREKWILENQ